MNELIPDLFRAIVDALKAMDAEAQLVNGKPTGLNDYGRWARQDLKRPQTEVEWTRELARRLNCKREVGYPSVPKKRCDLVMENCWIEVKGLWPAYWEKMGGRSIYEAYLFDPLKPYPSLKKSHTAARDVAKLRSLPAAEAPVVGLVLIGFDTIAAPCDEDVKEFTKLTGLETWWQGSASWADAYLPGQTVKVWGWFETRTQ